MKTVFLFAGQGSQYVGMGSDFYEEYSAYKNSIDLFGGEFKQIMFEGSEDVLKQTMYTQPCMALFAIGVLAVLEEAGIRPDAACGLSIGEYGALYAAGMLTAKGYVDIVSYRGKVMQEASQGIECAMSAIMGLEATVVEQAVAQCRDKGYVTVANYNCPGQYVICGDEAAVAACEEVCREFGSKPPVRLNVSGPFHTGYMKVAGEKLRARLDEMTFDKPKIPVLLNVSGTYYAEENMSEILEKQIQSGVHFEEELVQLLQDGYDTFIEIGPGKALTGFVKRTAKKLKISVNTFSIDHVQDIKDLQAKLQM